MRLKNPQYLPREVHSYAEPGIKQTGIKTDLQCWSLITLSSPLHILSPGSFSLYFLLPLLPPLLHPIRTDWNSDRHNCCPEFLLKAVIHAAPQNQLLVSASKNLPSAIVTLFSRTCITTLSSGDSSSSVPCRQSLLDQRSWHSAILELFDFSLAADFGS